MAETVIIANLSDALKLLQHKFDEVQADNQANNNAFFMCSMGLIIFFMQCGFAFLEAGAVRSKNTTNILIKNVLDSCIVIIAYAITGYAFAYGGDENSTMKSFMGTSGFFMSGVTDYPKFFFQYVFAATAATIVSGAVVERCEFACYLVYCTVISAVVYPIITHWGWSPYGWMASGIAFGDGRLSYIDFAGAGMVHLCGGTISFFAAYMIGARIGRFPEKDAEVTSPEIQGHSVPFAALGGFILMFGFLAFNGGSTAEISTHDVGKTIALAMTNTIMSGAFAALVYLVIHHYTNGKWTLILTINACLAGMVAACGACNNMDPWCAALTGTGASFAYLGFSKLMLKLKIDDPLDAFAVHAGGGLWGLIAACLFSRTGILYNFIDFLGGHESHVSLAFAQLGWQLICALAIIVWSAALMVPVFWVLKKLGKFRVPPEVEIKGLDIYKHGEAAYPIHAYGHGWDDHVVTSDGHKKSFSALAEISIEELANAYERKTSVLPKADTRKLSFYHNRQRYEHPEHHQINIKNGNTKPNGTSTNGKPVTTGPVLGITINDEQPSPRKWEP